MKKSKEIAAKVIGARLNINGINVSVMGLTNASVGGLGPNEDIEGNVNLFWQV